MCLPEVLSYRQRVPHLHAVDVEARHKERRREEQELCPGSAVSAVSGEDAEVDDGLGGASSTPECAYLIGPRRRPALRSCRGDRASRPGFSATAYVVPTTPVFWLLPGGGSASAAGVTVACTPVCGCVPGCADDLEFLIRGQAIHLTISAYRFRRL